MQKALPLFAAPSVTREPFNVRRELAWELRLDCHLVRVQPVAGGLSEDQKPKGRKGRKSGAVFIPTIFRLAFCASQTQ